MVEQIVAFQFWVVPGILVEVFKVFARDRFQQLHPHRLVPWMRRLKVFFALFPRFEKVRDPAAGAEMTRQVQISTLSAQMFLPESSRTRAHGRQRFMSWRVLAAVELAVAAAAERS